MGQRLNIARTSPLARPDFSALKDPLTAGSQAVMQLLQYLGTADNTVGEGWREFIGGDKVKMFNELKRVKDIEDNYKYYPQLSKEMQETDIGKSYYERWLKDQNQDPKPGEGNATDNDAAVDAVVQRVLEANAKRRAEAEKQASAEKQQQFENEQTVQQVANEQKQAQADAQVANGTNGGVNLAAVNPEQAAIQQQSGMTDGFSNTINNSWFTNETPTSTPQRSSDYYHFRNANTPNTYLDIWPMASQTEPTSTPQYTSFTGDVPPMTPEQGARLQKSFADMRETAGSAWPSFDDAPTTFRPMVPDIANRQKATIEWLADNRGKWRWMSNMHPRDFFDDYIDYGPTGARSNTEAQ